MAQDQTAWTLATAPGAAGIAVILIAGPRAFDILDEIFQTPCGDAGRHGQGTLSYGHIVKGGTTLDEVIVGAAPQGDGVLVGPLAEINCHGGPVAAHDVGEELGELGADRLEWSDFASAFSALSDHESHALDALTAAPTRRALRAAIAAFDGIPGQRLSELRARAEETTTPKGTTELVSDVESALEAHRAAQALFRPRRLAVVGPPNVGKSSLVNALLGRQRLLVHELPGTTRDTVDVSLALSGWPVILVDTAGIRDTEDEVERLGVKRSVDAIRDADAAIVVLDATDPDTGLLERLRTIPQAHVIPVLNKADLIDETGGASRIPPRAQEPGGCSAEETPVPFFVWTSALTGEGVKELGDRLLEEAGLGGDGDEEPLLFDERSVRELEDLRRRLLGQIANDEEGPAQPSSKSL